MRCLLDTHIFIWWIVDDPRLGRPARDAIADPANRLYLSAASTWEIMIKARLGKLALPECPEAFIDRQLGANAMEPLPITVQHTMGLKSLEDVHKDPFDRMLIAQANDEDMVLITDDPLIKKYAVRTL